MDTPVAEDMLEVVDISSGASEAETLVCCGSLVFGREGAKDWDDEREREEREGEKKEWESTSWTTRSIEREWKRKLAGEVSTFVFFLFRMSEETDAAEDVRQSE